MINSQLVGTTPDGENIYLEYSWSSANNYQYIITNIKKCTPLIRDGDQSFYLAKDIDIELFAFKAILNDKLIFTSMNTGIEITIDPRIKETRDTIRIYTYTSGESKDSTKVFCLKRAWYYIEKIPFDTNFFKVGHAYRINNSKGRITDDGFVYALLREITCEHMNFVYISDLSFGVTDTLTVSAREYRRTRYDHERRYYAMDPNDKWTDEIRSDKNDMTDIEPTSTDKNMGLTEEEIYDTVREYLLPEYEKWEAIGGGLTNSSYASGSGWCFAFGNGSCRPRDLGSYLVNDEWHIYNDYFDSEHESTTNIIIQKDRVHFIEDSTFNDFDRDFMYGLYEKLAKRLHDKELNKNE